MAALRAQSARSPTVGAAPPLIAGRTRRRSKAVGFLAHGWTAKGRRIKTFDAAARVRTNRRAIARIQLASVRGGPVGPRRQSCLPITRALQVLRPFVFQRARQSQRFELAWRHPFRRIAAEPHQFGCNLAGKALTPSALVDQEVFEHAFGQRPVRPTQRESIGNAWIKLAEMVRAQGRRKSLGPRASDRGKCCVLLTWRLARCSPVDRARRFRCDERVCQKTSLALHAVTS